MENKKIFNRSFVLMLITGFLLFMSIMMISPIMASYATSLNVTGSVVGLLAGIFSIASLIIRPISGNAIDLKNKKKLLMGSIGIVSIAMLGYTFTNSIGALFFFRILHGLGWGFASTTSMAIATDAIPHKRLATGIGYYGMMQMMTSAIAPSLGLAIANQWGYQSTFLCASCLALGSLLMTPFVMTKAPRNGHLSLLKSIKLENLLERSAIMPALLTMCNAMAGVAVGTFLVMYARKYGIVDIGLYFTVNALIMVSVRPLMGYLTERIGISKVIIPCEIMIALSVIGLGFSRSLSAVIVVAVFMGIGNSGAGPALIAECIHSTKTERRGIATSTNYVGLDGGNFLGSLISGSLVTLVGYTGMFSFFALPILIMIPFYLLTKKKKHIANQHLETINLIS
jgi:MFS family permease